MSLRIISIVEYVLRRLELSLQQYTDLIDCGQGAFAPPKLPNGITQLSCLRLM